MDDLIFDCYSIFWQILLNVVGEETATFEFRLTCYIFACLLVLMILFFIFRMLFILTNSVVLALTGKK